MSHRFSIIVPIYNAEKNISQCINSIRAQTCDDFECFLIDDGSTDASKAICEKAVRSDSRFKLISKTNTGVSDTRNVGIDLASGEWLAFCDADDTMTCDRLETAYAAAMENDVQIVWNAMNIIVNGKVNCVWHDNIPSGMYLTEDNTILSNRKYDIGHTPNKLYRTRLIKDNGIFFPNIKMAEDLIFNIHAFYTAGHIYNIHAALYNYNRHSDSATFTYEPKSAFIGLYAEYLRLCSKFKHDPIFVKNQSVTEAFIKNVIHI